MSMRAVIGMWREQFIRTGGQLAIIVAIAVLFELSFGIGRATFAPGYDDFYGAAGVFFALMLSSAILLVFYHDDSDLRLGLPNYVLRLPVSTWAIVLTRMVYNIAAIAMVLFITCVAYDWATSGGRIDSVFWHGMAAVTGVTFDWAVGVESRDSMFWLGMLAFLAAHTISWAAGDRGWLVVAYGILLLIAVWALWANLPALHDFSVAAIFLLALLPAYAICWYGIARQRRGGRAFADQLVDAAVDAKIHEREADFPSAGAAQRWLEWRLMGGVHTAIALLITLAVCTYMWISFHSMQRRYAAIGADYNWESSLLAVLRELPEVAVTAVMLGAIVGSVRVFIAHLRLETGPFLFTRPISTRAIAESRFAVALRNVAVTGGFILIAVAISLVAALIGGSGRTNPPIDLLISHPLMGTVALGLLFIGVLGWFWSLTWIYAVGLLALAVFFGTVINPAFDISMDNYSWSTFWVAPGILLTIAVVWSVYRACALHLLSRKSLVHGVTLSITVLVAVLIHSEPLDPLDAIYYNFWTAVPFLSLPLAPFGLVPLSLHWMRHR